jgi:hypothetical protein
MGINFMEDSKIYDFLNKNLKPDDFKIDISMTAIFRSNILEQTLSSFFKNMFFERKIFSYRLVINVDPVGESSIDNIKNVIFKYFGNNYIINTPIEANLARAVKWTISNTNSKYIFNLEDDWKLLKKVYFSHMIELMETNKNLHFLRLPFGVQRFIENQEHYGFETWGEPHKKFAIPCFLSRGDILRNMANQIIEIESPEKQLQKISADNLLCTGRYYEANSQGHVVMDLGRKWKRKHGLPKTINVSYFENK